MKSCLVGIVFRKLEESLLMNLSIKTIYLAVLGSGCRIKQVDKEGIKIEVVLPGYISQTLINSIYPPKFSFYEGELVEIVLVGQDA
jgi:hypothetical protein